MARITTHRGSAKQTHNYYLADYYDAGPEFEGQWLGAGARRLGLEGAIDPKQFMRLLENHHPTTGERLSQRTRDNRRNGWDITFSAPKSVSIVFGLNNDRAVVDALRGATNDTLLEMEQDVMRRVNIAGGEQRHEKTRNFIAGVWVHVDARGVKGHVPDCQLHSHAFVSNHTFDEKSDRWLAADISNLFRDAQRYYESVFQSRLATNLQDLGYAVERTANGFEIAGVSRGLIDKFSKRTAQINERIDEGYAERLAAKHGVSLADAKGMIGALSRDRKGKSFSLDELQEHWQLQLTPAESRQLDQVGRSKLEPTPTKNNAITAQAAVDFALEHGFEHEAVLRERNVLSDALKHGIGDNSVAEIRAEVARRRVIRQGKEEAAVLTTKELQQEELAILNFAKQGRGQVKPLNAAYEAEASDLSEEQRRVVAGLLTSTDRLQVVHGVAGVGKSYMLQHLVPQINDASKPTAIMAPTNKAVDNLREDGFDAKTVQSFLLDEKAQSAVNGGVLIVDEAGLIGSPTFRALVRVADQQNARIIAVGDTRQHLPIERGHPLKMLEEQAGIEPESLSTIRRQEGSYRDAVEALSRGDISEGFERLQALDYVHEIADEERDAILARDFADAREKHPDQKLLVIAPTHAERRQVIDSIRDELKSRKLIGDEEHALTSYVPKQLSKAQRQDPLNYQAGDLVAFHAKGRGGIQSGDQLQVARVTNGKVFTEEGRTVPLESAGAFAVFRPEVADYAVGDVIRLTRGRRQEPGQKKLTNGSLHTIRSISNGAIRLDNGEKLAPDWRFFDQGIAVTSHVSQGTTVHRAFVAASSLSFPASSPEQMYVSASRARTRCDIYTDSTDGLERAISRFRHKQLATSVQPTQLGGRTPTRLLQAFNRVKSVAQQLATKQLQRFHDWLPRHEMQPQPER
ncbi:Multifunctional conjugation protein TraI [Posidoniimonas corsicana]|uniref:Multifunctional conjugation protein TraI n=1 Tax=Posidoniimonas corsicana TaxID=1938618 RepID=A0A5C5VBS5_9BACT|nr:MobF family relaxase [Posidoniimonas corsicana]TWT35172.1 Multifunctional conjugation protein TraI [Posidoniimonas corsicana]